MTDRAATPKGASSRLDMMDNISRQRVGEIAEDNKVDPSTIIDEESRAEKFVDPRLEARQDDEGEAAKKEEEAAKRKEEEVTDPQNKDVHHQEEEEGKKPEVAAQPQDIEEYLDIDSEEEKKYRFRVKVDGEEKLLTAAEMKRGYQKDATASKRLEEAAKTRKELEDERKVLDDREADIAKRESALNKRTVTTAAETALDGGDSTPNAHPPTEGDVKKLLDALYSDNEDEAVALFTRLLQPGRTQQAESATQEEAAVIDEASIVNKVRSAMSFEAAVNSFKDKYPDILEDEHLAKMADDFLSEEMETGISYDEAFTNAGDRVHDWMKERGMSTAQGKSRQEMKRELDTAVDAGASSTSTVTEEKPQSKSDVIKEMASVRGASRQYHNPT